MLVAVREDLPVIKPLLFICPDNKSLYFKSSIPEEKQGQF